MSMPELPEFSNQNSMGDLGASARFNDDLDRSLYEDMCGRLHVLGLSSGTNQLFSVSYEDVRLRLFQRTEKIGGDGASALPARPVMRLVFNRMLRLDEDPDYIAMQVDDYLVDLARQTLCYRQSQVEATGERGDKTFPVNEHTAPLILGEADRITLHLGRTYESSFRAVENLTSRDLWDVGSLVMQLSQVGPGWRDDCRPPMPITHT